MKLNQACSYTFVFNSFNFPAGTAVGTVRADEQWYGDERTDSIAKLAAQSAAAPKACQLGSKWLACRGARRNAWAP